MLKQTFKFAQTRGLGEKVEFTFNFWKENFKTITVSVLTICVPFLVLGTGLSSYSASSYMTDAITSPGSITENPFGMFLSPALYFGYVFSIIGYILLNAIGIASIKVYTDKSMEFTPANIRSTAFSNMGKVFTVSFVGGIFTVLASLLFIIPGIYLGIAFSIAVPIAIFEDENITDSLARSRELVKDNWWSTFFFLFIFGIIASIGSTLVSFVSGVVIGADMVSIISGGGNIEDSIFNLLSIPAILSSFFTPILYVLVYIGIGVQYFSLREEKESTSILEEVESMA